MQKLREFRHRHELEWGWQAEELASRSRRERGELIHNQRSNAVADIAAVLAGAGRGNKMWRPEPLPAEAEAADADAAAAATEEAAASEEAEAKAQSAGAAAPENIDETTATAGSPARSKRKSKAKAKAVAAPAPKTLVQANIYWSNDADQHWASEWTENVTHSVGLPEHITNRRFKTSYLLEEHWEGPEVPEAGNAQGTVVGPDTAAEQEQPQRKKGWLGWLGGKSGSSSQETRV